MTVTNVTCQVKVDWKLSMPFASSKGLRQRGGLACLLCNLALERVIRDSRVKTTGTIFFKSTQILEYADDIDIIDLRLSYVAVAYRGIEQAAENLGLQIKPILYLVMQNWGGCVLFFVFFLRHTV